jgi:hypothetical protein
LKCYKDSSGQLHRTQAEAKASGLKFETEIVPNDQQGMIDYMNALRAPTSPEPSFHPASEDEAQRGLNDVWPGDPYPDRPYQNGDPTTPYMGSRDPAARFTCTNCGKANPP